MHNRNGGYYFSDGKPLMPMMDNVLASRLGRVYTAANRGKFYPDTIDAGLVLRALLEEAGFWVVEAAGDGAGVTGDAN